MPNTIKPLKTNAAEASKPLTESAGLKVCFGVKMKPYATAKIPANVTASPKIFFILRNIKAKYLAKIYKLSVYGNLIKKSCY